MANIVNLDELAEIVPDGVRLGIGGVHLSRLPMALIQRILALGKKDFVFTSWGGGLPLELFLEANAVRKLIFCFSSLDIFGLAPRFRDALENNDGRCCQFELTQIKGRSKKLALPRIDQVAACYISATCAGLDQGVPLASL